MKKSPNFISNFGLSVQETGIQIRLRAKISAMNFIRRLLTRHITSPVCSRSKTCMVNWCLDVLEKSGKNWKIQMFSYFYLGVVWCDPCQSTELMSKEISAQNVCGIRHDKKNLKPHFQPHKQNRFCSPGKRDKAEFCPYLSNFLLYFAYGIYYFLSLNFCRKFTVKSCSKKGQSIKG